MSRWPLDTPSPCTYWHSITAVRSSATCSVTQTAKLPHPSVRFTALNAGQAFAFASQEWAHLIPDTVVWCPLAGYPVVHSTWAVWPAEYRNRDVAHLIVAFKWCPTDSA